MVSSIAIARRGAAAPNNTCRARVTSFKIKLKAENASVKFICFGHTYNITYYMAYARHPGYMVRRVKRWKSSIAGRRIG